jgi:hypothetical protein
LLYKKAAAAPQGSPNPSRRGESSPFRFAPARRRRRRRRREEENPEAYRQLAAYLAKPKDRTWELEDAAKPSTATPLLPLLRAAVSIHADDLAPPRFTAACTSACGHQGEAKLPRPSVVDPAFEPRRIAITPCRSCRHAAAGDAGLRARLGRFLVQVPPPPSPQARTRAAVFLFDPTPSSPHRRVSRHRRAPMRRAAGLLNSVPNTHERLPPTQARRHDRHDTPVTVRTHAEPPRGRSCARTPRRHRPELRHGGREPFQAT